MKSHRAALATRGGIEVRLAHARAELSSAEHSLIGSGLSPSQRAHHERKAAAARKAVAALERLLAKS